MKKVIKIAFITFIFAFAIVLIISCLIKTKPSNVLYTRAKSSESSVGMYPRSLYFALRKAYKIPINFEWNSESIGPIVSLQIKKWERLESVLDRISIGTGKLITYDVICGQVCILPVKDTTDEIVSVLDIRFSKELDADSVWDAIKEVIVTANEQNVMDKPVYAIPTEVSVLLPVNPQLTQYHKIELSLQNVTLREALCTIFAASNLDIGYNYYFLPSYYSLDIRSHPDQDIKSFNYGEDVRLGIDERCWWYDEIESLRGSRTGATPFSESRPCKEDKE